MGDWTDWLFGKVSPAPAAWYTIVQRKGRPRTPNATSLPTKDGFLPGHPDIDREKWPACRELTQRRYSVNQTHDHDRDIHTYMHTHTRMHTCIHTYVRVPQQNQLFTKLVYLCSTDHVV